MRCLRLMLAAALSAAAIVGTLSAAPAQAATRIGAYTYNRPSTIEFDNTTYLAWADTSSAGQVHVGIVNSDGTITVQWIDPQSTTFSGSGPTLAAANGAVVVTWLDAHLGCNGGSSPCEMLAEIHDGINAGFACETLFEGDVTDTPYLTSSGDNGAGPLYLTVVDGAGNMHVSTLKVPNVAPDCQFDISKVDLATSDTSWDGPAMVVSGYGTSSQHFWLMWAGTDPAHHLNIAEYGSNWVRIAKHTETNHATLTDMGAAWATGFNYVWMSYCGTNNVVYYQFFTSVNGGTEIQEPGASCGIDIYNGYYSGGAGISFDFSTGSMRLTWGDKNSHQIMQDIV